MIRFGGYGLGGIWYNAYKVFGGEDFYLMDSGIVGNLDF